MGCAAILNPCGFFPCLIQSLLNSSLPSRIILAEKKLSPGMAGAAGLSGLQPGAGEWWTMGTGLSWPPIPPLSTCNQVYPAANTCSVPAAREEQFLSCLTLGQATHEPVPWLHTLLYQLSGTEECTVPKNLSCKSDRLIVCNPCWLVFTFLCFKSLSIWSHIFWSLFSIGCLSNRHTCLLGHPVYFFNMLAQHQLACSLELLQVSLCYWISALMV